MIFTVMTIFNVLVMLFTLKLKNYSFQILCIFFIKGLFLIYSNGSPNSHGRYEEYCVMDKNGDLKVMICLICFAPFIL